jgi:hypothetical protein
MADKPPSPNPSNHWTAETKSGQTFEYGNTDDSKIEAQGKSIVRLWAVNKITDASNNAINYIYIEDNTKGEYTLQPVNLTLLKVSISVRYSEPDLPFCPLMAIRR